jgi:hypothetical protein
LSSFFEIGFGSSVSFERLLGFLDGGLPETVFGGINQNIIFHLKIYVKKFSEYLKIWFSHDFGERILSDQFDCGYCLSHVERAVLILIHIQ